jgi:two-component SAPR family response regulator
MSQPLNCIAIDDDELFLRSYEALFHDFDWLHLTESFSQPVKAATSIIQSQPDVIFLDLEMPHIEGDDLLEWLSPRLENLHYQPKVILVSSYVGIASIKHPLISGYFNKQDFLDSKSLEDDLKQLLLA